MFDEELPFRVAGAVLAPAATTTVVSVFMTVSAATTVVSVFMAVPAATTAVVSMFVAVSAATPVVFFLQRRDKIVGDLRLQFDCFVQIVEFFLENG